MFEDVRYDEKFYITVGAAIIAAILVGIFVMHAIFSYCEGKRLYTKGLSNLSCFDYLPILNSALTFTFKNYHTRFVFTTQSKIYDVVFLLK